MRTSPDSEFMLQKNMQKTEQTQCPRCAAPLTKDDCALCGLVVGNSRDSFIGQTLFDKYRIGRRVGVGSYAVVFEAEHHVAVFNLDKLALGNITFGDNSWRGDRYEPQLRGAITLWEEMEG